MLTFDAVESIAALPTDEQPGVWVSISEDAQAPEQIVHEIRIFGVRHGGVASGRPTTKQLEYRIQSALTGIRRFRVPSYDQIKRLKRMQDDGILQPGAATWALSPHYAVDCTILECAQTSSKGKRRSAPMPDAAPVSVK